MGVMSQPTTLIMTADQTFAGEYGDTLTITEFADLHNTTERNVKRWLEKKWIRPMPEQVGPKRQWRFAPTAMLVTEEEKRALAEAEKQALAEQAAAEKLTEAELLAKAVAQAAVEVAGTSGGEVAVPEITFDEEFADVMLGADLEAILDRLPAYIPIRIGAYLMGLGIGYVKAHPDEFGILKAGGPGGTDVMPKAVVAHRARLHVRNR